MSNSDNLGTDLFSKLKSRFPEIRLGDAEGMSTIDPKKAVFFDFDFTVDGEKVASISISTADKGSMKLFYTKDILKNQSELVKSKWFDFLRDMRNFSKTKLLTFDPKDITKKNLDKRDFKELAVTATNKFKDPAMTESSLYGSTRSSYQKLENTKLIIRHSKKIQEESPNSRTRNIDSLYVESEAGERFKYPFIHLSGARAMQRHVANGGNPYDGFGQYIVGLSEQVYNLRRFNHLVSRNSFLENSEILDIANAAREKTSSIKKTLERIQKQTGYETIKENFVEYKKGDIDPGTLETLKNKFTLQQFNEELVELFPYISDLIGEAKPFVKGEPSKGTQKATGDYDDSDAADEPIDNELDNIGQLENALESMPKVQIEKFDKASIQNSIDSHQAQIKDLKASVADNPKDKKTQYALEKAQARLGLLQARLGTADPQVANVSTKNALLIDHLSKHVKDDRLSSILGRISDEYGEMKKPDMMRVNALIKKMMSKAQVVDVFSNESTSFEELKSRLENTTTQDEKKDSSKGENIDPVYEFETLLDKAIAEASNLLSTDEDVRNKALEELNKLMTSHFPVGTNGINAIESLKGIIDDSELFNKFKSISQEDADTCARPEIMSWIQKNAPDLVNEIDTGDMEKMQDTKENEREPSKEPESDAEPKQDGSNKLVEIESFVKSLYDSNTGRFPRGETGVLASVEKRYGAEAVNIAQSMIENLKQSFDENIMRLRKLAGVN